MSDARTTAESSLPTSLVEVRPSRSLAVHLRSGECTTAKPRLIFVHGSMASMLQYGPLIAHFGTALGHEVVAYDWLGCGRSPKPATWVGYSIDEHRLDLAAIVQRYAATGPTVLVCHSAGCSLALGLLADAGACPSTVRGVCLLAGLAHLPPMPPIFKLPVCVLNMLQPTLSAGFEGLALHEKTRAGTTPERKAVLALARAVNGSNAMHVCKAYYRQLRLPAADELRAAAVRVPNILLLAGADDQIVSASQSEALRALLAPAAQLHVVPETSHQLMQEDPRTVCAHVADYLAALPRK